MQPRRLDALVGLAGAATGTATVLAWGDGADMAATAAILGATVAGARRYPRATWMAAVGILLATTLLGTLVQSLQGGGSFAVYLLVAAHLFFAGRCDSGRSAITGLLALMGAFEIAAFVAHQPSPAGFSVILAGAWFAGRAVREREQIAQQLAQRARELQEEREAHARLSVRYERARIASELHDIVAHAISVMVVQASAGQRLAARDPVGTAETFDAIAGAAHQAEQDMGRLVALLGDDDAIGPAPDLALVEELVTRAAGSGLHVTLRLEGEREGLPAAVVQAAYRVVQESLTNALRHASGAPVGVLVRGELQRLVVQVDNGPAVNDGAQLTDIGGGHGLAGLRARVGACGGTLQAGPTPDGGWRVYAQLPRRINTQHNGAHHPAHAPRGAPREVT